MPSLHLEHYVALGCLNSCNYLGPYIYVGHQIEPLSLLPSVIRMWSYMSIPTAVPLCLLSSLPSLHYNEVVCLHLKLLRSLGYISQVILTPVYTRVTTSLHMTDLQSLQM